MNEIGHATFICFFDYSRQGKQQNRYCWFKILRLLSLYQLSRSLYSYVFQKDSCAEHTICVTNNDPRIGKTTIKYKKQTLF